MGVCDINAAGNDFYYGLAPWARVSSRFGSFVVSFFRSVRYFLTFCLLVSLPFFFVCPPCHDNKMLLRFLAGRSKGGTVEPFRSLISPRLCKG